MTFVAALGAFAGKWLAAITPGEAPFMPDVRLIEIERDLDRSSDAFTEAVNLLERGLPRSFGA
jgi:hypothetical protein